MSRYFKRVAYDEFGRARVSTVLLGLDHSFGDSPPLIFETMVFGVRDENEYQWRYATKAEALAGHAQVLAAVRADALTHDSVTA